MLQVLSKFIVQIIIQRKFSCSSPYIRANIGRIKQVIMNLLSNAKDAISDYHEKGCIEILLYQTDEKIVLQVIDNGHGIADENLLHIFNPFYTTKEAGKGTGLGLAITHSIVTSFQGSIDVKSKLSEGTTFTLTFPKAKSKLAS